MRKYQATCVFLVAHGRVRSWQAGFSLIEVAIATLVIGIFIGSILTSITSGYMVLERSRQTLRANQILQQELETVRTYSWSQVTNSANFGSTNYSDSGVTYRITKSTTNFYNSTTYCTGNMVKVTVSALWTNATGSVITKDMTTVVAQGGLNDYFY